MMSFVAMAVLLFGGTVVEFLYIQHPRPSSQKAPGFGRTAGAAPVATPAPGWDLGAVDLRPVLADGGTNVDVTCGRCGLRHKGNPYVDPLIRTEAMHQSMKVPG
jgi:hypothetical protein